MAVLACASRAAGGIASSTLAVSSPEQPPSQPARKKPLSERLQSRRTQRAFFRKATRPFLHRSPLQSRSPASQVGPPSSSDVVSEGGPSTSGRTETERKDEAWGPWFAADAVEAAFRAVDKFGAGRLLSGKWGPQLTGEVRNWLQSDETEGESFDVAEADEPQARCSWPRHGEALLPAIAEQLVTADTPGVLQEVEGQELHEEFASVVRSTKGVGESDDGVGSAPRCAWPRTRLGAVVAPSEGPRCAWPSTRSVLPTLEEEILAVENEQVSGPQCAWPRVHQPAALQIGEAMQEEAKPATGARCTWPRSPLVSQPASASALEAGPRCGWPRSASAAAMDLTPQSASPPSPHLAAARCTWPRYPPSAAAEVRTFPHCAWPRSAGAALGADLPELRQVECVEPAAFAGARCAWPRVPANFQLAIRAEGPRCAWPKEGVKTFQPSPALVPELAVSKVATESVGGARCAWPRHVVESLSPAPASQDVVVGARCAWPKVGGLDTASVTPAMAAARCEWPRKCNVAAETVFDEVVAVEGARCAWPRVAKPMSESSVAFGARCEWPRPGVSPSPQEVIPIVLKGSATPAPVEPLPVLATAASAPSQGEEAQQSSGSGRSAKLSRRGLFWRKPSSNAVAVAMPVATAGSAARQLSTAAEVLEAEPAGPRCVWPRRLLASSISLALAQQVLLGPGEAAWAWEIVASPFFEGKPLESRQREARSVVQQ